MGTIDQHIIEEMWRKLRDDVVCEWERLVNEKPDVTTSSVTLYTAQGSLEAKFQPETKRVTVAVRPCCEDEDCRTPVEKRELSYEVAINSGGKPRWRRANFEHDPNGMGRVLVYHLLKHRDTL